MSRIKVVDLFAGPGGLGEGFAASDDFELVLSIEKDVHAHQTLELRSFVRAFDAQQVPDDYYDYVRGELQRDELFARHPEQAEVAKRTAWKATLGETSRTRVKARVVEALGSGGEPWVLIGGPPCQAYSVVGRLKLEREWRKTIARRDGNSAHDESTVADQARTEFEKDRRHYLYEEYLQIIADHKPTVFVMENVKGLLSAGLGTKNMFDVIKEDLEDPDRALRRRSKGDDRPRQKSPHRQYHVFPVVDPDRKEPEARDYVVKFEKFGIPQRRHRIILVGVRVDILGDVARSALGIEEATVCPSVEDAIYGLPKLRSGVG